MKVTMTLTIDVGIAKLLSEQPNKSGLVNRLLHNYFENQASIEIDNSKINEEIKNATGN